MRRELSGHMRAVFSLDDPDAASTALCVGPEKIDYVAVRPFNSLFVRCSSRLW